MKKKSFFNIYLPLYILFEVAALALFIGSLLFSVQLFFIITTLVLNAVAITLIVLENMRIAHVKKMTHRVLEETKMGLAHLIDIYFEPGPDRYLSDFSESMNLMLQEIRRIFWMIKESLFETQINSSTIENMKLMMITYIQKVVNISGVQTELESICQKIASATKATDRILTMVKKMADQTDEEAAAIKESASAIELMLERIHRITEITREEQELAQNLKAITEKGGEGIEKTNVIIEDLSKSTGQMLKIIEIIEDITETTNILSINAGIEAAHAGSRGNGFKIITGEIKRLVDSSRKNSNEIALLLKEQVGKINQALHESGLSGEVFKEVNKDVNAATATWLEISENTIEMSGRARTLQDVTSKMFDMTGDVKESADFIRDGIQEVTGENSALEAASRRTLEVFDRVTVTNTEAQESTMEILQQLNEMGKFISDLNKSISFINMGRRIFFLFFEKDLEEKCIKAILRSEYEIYPLNDHNRLLKLLNDYENAVLLINIDKKPVDFILEDFLKSVKKHSALKPAIITGNPDVWDQDMDVYKNIPFIHITPQIQSNIKRVLSFIHSTKARGLRKYIRIDCEEKDQLFFSVMAGENEVRGSMVNISSNSGLALFPKEVLPLLPDNEIQLKLSIMGKRVKLKAKKNFSRENGEVLFAFHIDKNLEVKDFIHSYIYRKLQEYLEKELVSIVKA